MQPQTEINKTNDELWGLTPSVTLLFSAFDVHCNDVSTLSSETDRIMLVAAVAVADVAAVAAVVAVVADSQ